MKFARQIPLRCDAVQACRKVPKSILATPFLETVHYQQPNILSAAVIGEACRNAYTA